MISVEEFDGPAKSLALTPFAHLWDELERRLRARPNQPTSVSDLFNTVAAEWKEVPAAMFKHRVEAFIAAMGGM